MTSKRHKLAARSAFTLIEMVMSLAVTSILMAAMGSVLVLATRSLDGDNGPASQSITASSALQEIARDVNMALNFTARTDAGVTPVVLEFTVPDRNGDLAPETIRYEWSGIPGTPLFRSYNGSGAVSIAEDVQQLSLSYLTRFRKGVAPPPPPPPEESGEVMLSSLNPGGTGTADFSSVDLHGEYFKPTLPKNTLSWKITRVEVSMARRTASSTGQAIVSIRNVDGSFKPTGAPLESQSVSITTIPTTLTNVMFSFSSVSGLDPSKGISFIVGGDTSTRNGKVLLKGALSTGANLMYQKSNNSGGSWSTPDSTRALSFTVFGTYTTQGPPKW